MSERPAKIGIDAVVTYWENANEGNPFFSIWWNSREKATQYAGDSMDEAAAKLQKWLEVNNSPGDTALYYLRIQSESEKAYKWNSPIVESIPFRFNPAPDYVMSGTGGAGNWQLMQAIAGIKEDIAARERRLEARLAELEGEEDADDTAQDKLFAKISGIIDNPHIGPVIGNFLGMIMNKVTGGAMQQPAAQQPQRVAINGVNDTAPAVSQNNASTAVSDQDQADALYQQQINDALVRLNNHCDLASDLTLLADMADSNPMQFKMLLGMLRK